MSERNDFYLYVDEFQNFSTDSFANILSEARKYRLNLILAHQYIEQLNEKVRYAIFGNVGTMVCFRVGAEDAEFLEKEFAPQFMATDFVNLAKYDIYVKLMIDGVSSRPFSAKGMKPYAKTPESFADVIIENSRSRYAMSKSAVEEKIAEEWASKADSIDNRVQRRDERSLDRVLRRDGGERSFHRDNYNRDNSSVHRENPVKKERKPVDVDDLRSAIEQSLNKNNNENTEQRDNR